MIGVLPKALPSCVLLLAMTFAGGAVARADAVSEAIDKARADGLPVAPLASKAAEGRAKRVPAARIAQVIGALARYMRQARDYYEGRPSSNKGAARAKPPAVLLAAIAEARLAGIEAKLLRQLVPDAAAAAAARRVDALSDLHLRGFPAGRALGLVKRARAADLAGLGRLADTLRKRGFSPARAIDELTRGVGKNRSLAAHAARAARKGARPAATKGRGRGRGYDKK